MALIVPAQMIGIEQLLFYLVGANMNTGAVQPMTSRIGQSPPKYVITRAIASRPSISLTTAVGGLFAGNRQIVSAAQAYSAMVGSDDGIVLTLDGVAGALVPHAVVPHLDLVTPQGAPATADFYLWGAILPPDFASVPAFDAP